VGGVKLGNLLADIPGDHEQFPELLKMGEFGHNQGTKLMERICRRCKGLLHVRENGMFFTVDDGMENFLFTAREMMIDGRVCHAEGTDDVCERCLAKATPGEYRPGGIEDPVFVEHICHSHDLNDLTYCSIIKL
jgi:ribosomal protein L40E